MSIRIRLLWSVNPRTDGQKCDRIRIAATLRLDDDENSAGLLFIEARCFVEKECPDVVIFQSSDFRLWHEPDQRRCALYFRSWAKKATSRRLPRSYQLKDQ